MGRRSGGDAALTPALAETLARVAAVLADAGSPWWVIGSAAVVLHGGDTEVRDVDVLLAPADAERVAAVRGLANVAGDRDNLFRSAMLLRWDGPPLTVEFMAGLHVRAGGGWTPIVPVTRMALGGVHVPERAELGAILRAFGRPKDLARLALLTPACGTG